MQAGFVVLGWRERLDLPELGIHRLRAKVDSGARTSCLHVEWQEAFRRDDAEWVRFGLRPRFDRSEVIEREARVVDMRAVTDSGGHRTQRVFIRTRLQLAGVTREIEVNLADRRGMRFPMLLGRSAMDGGFVVNPSRSWLHNRHPTRRNPR